nr:ESPR domain-containing protein [Escherichia coli]
MNKIFKVIWNPATGNYTVTSETALLNKSNFC